MEGRSAEVDAHRGKDPAEEGGGWAAWLQGDLQGVLQEVHLNIAVALKTVMGLLHAEEWSVAPGPLQGLHQEILQGGPGFLTRVQPMMREVQRAEDHLQVAAA